MGLSPESILERSFTFLRGIAEENFHENFPLKSLEQCLELISERTSTSNFYKTLSGIFLIVPFGVLRGLKNFDKKNPKQ